MVIFPILKASMVIDDIRYQFSLRSFQTDHEFVHETPLEMIPSLADFLFSHHFFSGLPVHG
jgi:hypothetical protein